MGKARIMVVDDESVVRMDIKEMILDEGYDVVAEASNGEAAVEQALLKLPDLILMDVKMPKMDGLKASRIIYQKTKIPILALTAYTQSQLIDEAKDAGIITYLVKPVTESDLVPGIEMALAQAARMKELSEKVEHLSRSLDARKRIEQAKGVLMHKKDIPEAEAYQKMRTYCMDNSMKMEELANRIIDLGYLLE